MTVSHPLPLHALALALQDIGFHFEALLHNNILCKHPLYCAIYCTILTLLIAPPTQF